MSAYPRIGVDDRNQFDFYRDMPGGLNGLRELSRRCHRRNVKVLIDYNPWDTGTRREGKNDLDGWTARPTGPCLWFFLEAAASE